MLFGVVDVVIVVSPFEVLALELGFVPGVCVRTTVTMTPIMMTTTRVDSIPTPLSERRRADARVDVV
jgi:hypothetical protein